MASQSTKVAGLSGRPRRACHQCNVQKLRCTGGRPTCERCRKLGRQCNWSAYDARPMHFKPSHLQVTHTVPRSHSYVGIPVELALKFIDVLSSCLYSSSLLYHRKTLLQDVQENKAKPHLILSISAFASSFLDSADQKNVFRDTRLSREWAEQAGRLLFSEAERPGEDKIVSFTLLCLFWYSQGDWPRSIVHQGNALVHIRLTAFSKEDGRTATSLQSELRHRRFWATYIISQYVSEPFTSLSPVTIAQMPLPCEEDLYQEEVLSTQKFTLRDDVRTASIFAEVVRITALWSEVYRFVRGSDKEPVSSLSALNELDAKLRRWYQGLPAKFSFDGTNRDLDTVTRLSIFIIHIIYHQCVCALHASVVPLFSLGPAQQFSPYLYNQRVSAQIAHEHACAISSLAQRTLAQYPDDAVRWSSFIGYTLYCSCAIQIPFLWSVDQRVSEHAKSNLRTNLETMAKIGLNWPYVLNLGLHVRILYQYHSTEPVALPGQLQNFSASDLAGKRKTNDSPRPVLGQREMVWDLQRTLARGETMTMDPNQSPRFIQACKELIEGQAPLRDHTPRTDSVRGDEGIDTIPSRDPSPTHHSPEVSWRPPPEASNTHHEAGFPPHPVFPAPTPPSVFGDFNLNDVTEQDQISFLQVLPEIRNQNEEGGLDLVEDWLFG